MTLTESQLMALSMFKGKVPCGFSMIDNCEKLATWVCIYEHVPASECTESPPMPVCDEHKKTLWQATSPFWLMWLGDSKGLQCECGSEIQIAEWRPLT